MAFDGLAVVVLPFVVDGDNVVLVFFDAVLEHFFVKACSFNYLF